MQFDCSTVRHAAALGTTDSAGLRPFDSMWLTLRHIRSERPRRRLPRHARKRAPARAERGTRSRRVLGPSPTTVFDADDESRPKGGRTQEAEDQSGEERDDCVVESIDKVTREEDRQEAPHDADETLCAELRYRGNDD